MVESEQDIDATDTPPVRRSTCRIEQSKTNDLHVEKYFYLYINTLPILFIILASSFHAII